MVGLLTAVLAVAPDSVRFGEQVAEVAAIVETAPEKVLKFVEIAVGLEKLVAGTVVGKLIVAAQSH